ncbi:MAG: PQQ-binding-like beta-propeller repeat protein [bacterium]|nr:PQQ-binding-like beta-propeller repeat protein [bacterium]
MPAEWGVLAAATATFCVKTMAALGAGSAWREKVEPVFKKNELNNELTRAFEAGFDGFVNILSGTSFVDEVIDARLREMFADDGFQAILSDLPRVRFEDLDTARARELFEGLGLTGAGDAVFEDAWAALGRCFRHQIAQTTQATKLVELGQRDRIEGHLSTLTESRRNESPTPAASCRAVNMAQCPAADFVPRPNELDDIVEKLRKAPEAVGITTALRGAGGFGKTTVAKALAYDERVRKRFPGGILWVEMGEDLSEGDRVAKYRELLTSWTGIEPPSFETAAVAGTAVRQALADRHRRTGQDLLVIVDDVWSSADIEPIRGLIEGATFLITTRNRKTLPAGCETVDVNAMRREEAVKLLAFGLDDDATVILGPLARRLGDWPLLLKLVNGQLRELTEDGLDAHRAVAEMEEILTERKLTEFDSDDEHAREYAVKKTLEVSFERLSNPERERFFDLAILPEDADIPLDIVQRLWTCDEYATKKLCARFMNLSLLLGFNRLGKGTIRLHDVIRKYLADEQPLALRGLHQKLLAACCPQSGSWADLKPGAIYLWHNLLYHLVNAADGRAIRKTLFDYDYLHAKLRATPKVATNGETKINVNMIISDYDRAIRALDKPEVELQALEAELRATRGALGLSREVLSGDGNQLAGQLLGRLSPQDGPEIKRLLKRARHFSWFRPRVPSLTSPGGQPLIRTLEGHTDWIRAVAVIDDQRVVSASDDRTLRVWNVVTGEPLRTFEGHQGWVRAVAVINKQWIVSAADDETLRVWEPHSNKELKIWEEKAGICALAVIGENRIVTALRDSTLRLLDVFTGEESRRFEGHKHWVRAVAVNNKGRMASGSEDNTVRVWDLDTGESQRTLEGHSGGVTAVAWVDEHRIVSASADNTLRLWDANTGERIRGFEKGHEDTVNGLAVIGRGASRCVISASADKTLRKWDVETGLEVQKEPFEGHIGPINAVVEIPGGTSSQIRVVSASSDHTLRVWNVEAEPYQGHQKSLEGLTALDTTTANIGSTIVSISRDLTLRQWNVAQGLQVLPEKKDIWANAVTTVDDKRIALGSPDGSLRVLNLETGDSEDLEGHDGHNGHEPAVNTVARIDDLRIVSGLSDYTLRIWNVKTKKNERILKGHTSGVLAVAVIKGEGVDPCRIVSASDDDTLRVWEVETGKELKTLEGHTRWINDVAVIDRNRIVSASADSTLRVWDLKTGKQIRALKDRLSNAWLNAVAVIDERHVVSASEDHALRLWDIEEGKIIAIFELEEAVQSVLFESGTLVAGDQSGRLHIFDLADSVERVDEMPRGELIIQSDKFHDFQLQSSSLFEELEIVEEDWARHLGVSLNTELPDDIGRTEQKGEPPIPEKMDLLIKLFKYLCEKEDRNRAGVLFAKYLWGPFFYIYDERRYMRKLLEDTIGVPDLSQIGGMKEGEIFALNQLANAWRADICDKKAAGLHQAILDRDEKLLKEFKKEEDSFLREKLRAIRLELLGLDQINICEYAAAEENLKRSRDLSLELEARGLGNTNRVSCLRDLGRLYLRKENPERNSKEALVYLKEAGVLARKGGGRKYLARTLAFQSTALLEQQDEVKALQRAEAAVEADAVRKKSRVQAAVLIVRAKARRANRDLEGAIEDVQVVRGRKRVDLRKKESADILLEELQLDKECVEEARKAAERALSDALQDDKAESAGKARDLLAEIRKYEK